MLLNLFVGLVAGLLAKALMPGERGESSGWIVTMILGLVGGFVGGLLFGLIGIHAWGLIGRIIVSTVGAVVLIAIFRQIKR